MFILCQTPEGTIYLIKKGKKKIAFDTNTFLGYVMKASNKSVSPLYDVKMVSLETFLITFGC